MSRTPRTAEEIKKYEKHILDTAVLLIVKEGYRAFSMRKLAQKLGVSATAIYNYYKGKEDLYLHVLIRGFDELASRLSEAYNAGCSKKDKFRRFVKAYIDFGTSKANLYNIMLVWDVPKYYDFVGTSSEAVAKTELDTAKKVVNMGKIVFDVINNTEDKTAYSNPTAYQKFVCGIHGFISLYNSQVLGYLSDGVSESGNEEMIEGFIDELTHEFFDN